MVNLMTLLGVREVVVDHPGDCGRTVNEVMIAGGCVQRRKVWHCCFLL